MPFRLVFFSKGHWRDLCSIVSELLMAVIATNLKFCVAAHTYEQIEITIAWAFVT